MKVLVPLGFVVTVLVLSGCASEEKEPAQHPVVKLAAFDLQCPRSKLLYTPIDKRNLGVQGCGRQARYVKLCREVRGTFGPEDECRWVRND
jgi:hypothetical protein